MPVTAYDTAGPYTLTGILYGAAGCSRVPMAGVSTTALGLIADHKFVQRHVLLLTPWAVRLRYKGLSFSFTLFGRANPERCPSGYKQEPQVIGQSYEKAEVEKGNENHEDSLCRIHWQRLGFHI